MVGNCNENGDVRDAFESLAAVHGCQRADGLRALRRAVILELGAARHHIRALPVLDVNVDDGIWQRQQHA